MNKKDAVLELLKVLGKDGILIVVIYWLMQQISNKLDLLIQLVMNLA